MSPQCCWPLTFSEYLIFSRYWSVWKSNRMLTFTFDSSTVYTQHITLLHSDSYWRLLFSEYCFVQCIRGFCIWCAIWIQYFTYFLTPVWESFLSKHDDRQVTPDEMLRYWSVSVSASPFDLLGKYWIACTHMNIFGGCPEVVLLLLWLSFQRGPDLVVLDEYIVLLGLSCFLQQPMQFVSGCCNRLETRLLRSMATVRRTWHMPKQLTWFRVAVRIYVSWSNGHQLYDSLATSLAPGHSVRSHSSLSSDLA